MLLAVVVSLLARGHDDEFERGRHLAAATSFGWAAVPAALAVFFAWSPGPWLYVALVVAILAGALFLATRALGPASGFARWTLRAAASLLAASAGVFALAAGCAALLGRRARAEFPPLGGALRDRRRSGDAPAARVQCRTARHLGRAAARRAPGVVARRRATLVRRRRRDADAGRRQIHRMDRATGQGGLLELRRPRQQRASFDLSEWRLARLPVRSARHLAPSGRHRSVSRRGAARATSPIPAAGSASRSDPTSRPSSVPVR